MSKAVRAGGSRPQSVTVAIVGATGAVGQEFLKILSERNFPVGNLRLMASQKSAGKKMAYEGKEYIVEDLATADPAGIDVALFSAGASTSRAFASKFADAGAMIVDNSSAFRMDRDVPLVVPEVNPEQIRNAPRRIIANPNCSTIIALVPLWPLHKRARLKRAVISTYQAVSGAGARAIEELDAQTRTIMAGQKPSPRVFSHQIAFNIFCHNSKIGADGYNEEETKMTQETHKIFGDSSIGMTATCVRVPTFRSHAEAINAEFHDSIDADEAREILRNAPGIKVVDDRERNYFPMPIDTAGQDLVYVGRIRKDSTAVNSLALFVSGDQLRKGAATNAVQIAELLINPRKQDDAGHPHKMSRPPAARLERTVS